MTIERWFTPGPEYTGEKYRGRILKAVVLSESAFEDEGGYFYLIGPFRK